MDLRKQLNAKEALLFHVQRVLMKVSKMHQRLYAHVKHFNDSAGDAAIAQILNEQASMFQSPSPSVQAQLDGLNPMGDMQAALLALQETQQTHPSIVQREPSLPGRESSFAGSVSGRESSLQGWEASLPAREASLQETQASPMPTTNAEHSMQSLYLKAQAQASQAETNTSNDYRIAQVLAGQTQSQCQSQCQSQTDASTSIEYLRPILSTSLTRDLEDEGSDESSDNRGRSTHAKKSDKGNKARAHKSKSKNNKKKRKTGNSNSNSNSNISSSSSSSSPRKKASDDALTRRQIRAMRNYAHVEVPYATWMGQYIVPRRGSIVSHITTATKRLKRRKAGSQPAPTFFQLAWTSPMHVSLESIRIMLYWDGSGHMVYTKDMAKMDNVVLNSLSFDATTKFLANYTGKHEWMDKDSVAFEGPDPVLARDAPIRKLIPLALLSYNCLMEVLYGIAWCGSLSLSAIKANYQASCGDYLNDCECKLIQAFVHSFYVGISYRDCYRDHPRTFSCKDKWMPKDDDASEEEWMDWLQTLMESKTFTNFFFHTAIIIQNAAIDRNLAKKNKVEDGLRVKWRRKQYPRKQDGSNSNSNSKKDRNRISNSNSSSQDKGKKGTATINELFDNQNEMNGSDEVSDDEQVEEKDTLDLRSSDESSDGCETAVMDDPTDEERTQSLTADLGVNDDNMEPANPSRKRTRGVAVDEQSIKRKKRRIDQNTANKHPSKKKSHNDHASIQDGSTTTTTTNSNSKSKGQCKSTGNSSSHTNESRNDPARVHNKATVNESSKDDDSEHNTSGNEISKDATSNASKRGGRRRRIANKSNETLSNSNSNSTENSKRKHNTRSKDAASKDNIETMSNTKSVSNSKSSNIENSKRKHNTSSKDAASMNDNSDSLSNSNSNSHSKSNEDRRHKHNTRSKDAPSINDKSVSLSNSNSNSNSNCNSNSIEEHKSNDKVVARRQNSSKNPSKNASSVIEERKMRSNDAPNSNSKKARMARAKRARRENVSFFPLALSDQYHKILAAKMAALGQLPRSGVSCFFLRPTYGPIPEMALTPMTDQHERTITGSNWIVDEVMDFALHMILTHPSLTETYTYINNDYYQNQIARMPSAAQRAKEHANESRSRKALRTFTRMWNSTMIFLILVKGTHWVLIKCLGMKRGRVVIWVYDRCRNYKEYCVKISLWLAAGKKLMDDDMMKQKLTGDQQKKKKKLMNDENQQTGIEIPMENKKQQQGKPRVIPKIPKIPMENKNEQQPRQFPIDNQKQKQKQKQKPKGKDEEEKKIPEVLIAFDRVDVKKMMAVQGNLIGNDVGGHCGCWAIFYAIRIVNKCSEPIEPGMPPSLREHLRKLIAAIKVEHSKQFAIMAKQHQPSSNEAIIPEAEVAKPDVDKDKEQGQPK